VSDQLVGDAYADLALATEHFARLHRMATEASSRGRRSAPHRGELPYIRRKRVNGHVYVYFCAAPGDAFIRLPAEDSAEFRQAYDTCLRNALWTAGRAVIDKTTALLPKGTVRTGSERRMHATGKLTGKRPE
jgi:hypothetical protein